MPSSKLPQDQLDRVERFQSAYNRVDHFLRKKLKRDNGAAFMGMVKEYAGLYRGWRYRDFLISVAELRNMIVHTKVNPYEYVAIPADYILQQLEECLSSLENPKRVIPTFKRVVDVFRVQDTLSSVFHHIHRMEYSQFPIYDGDKFMGLLTENGITRWLAEHVVKELSLVELDEVIVAEVIRKEEHRKNYLFVSSMTHVDDAAHKFRENEFLEAVLITVSGKATEPLQGIMTKWDIFNS